MSAQVEINGEAFAGIIGNLSEEGIYYTLTTFVETERNIIPRENIRIILQISEYEKMSLECEIRWFVKPSESKKALLIGMQILNPPDMYKDWIRHLMANH